MVCCHPYFDVSPNHRLSVRYFFKWWNFRPMKSLYSLKFKLIRARPPNSSMAWISRNHNNSSFLRIPVYLIIGTATISTLPFTRSHLNIFLNWNFIEIEMIVRCFKKRKKIIVQRESFWILNFWGQLTHITLIKYNKRIIILSLPPEHHITI